MVKVKKDIPLIDEILKYDATAYGMNIQNSFNLGLQYEIGLNFPKVKLEECKTRYGDKSKYGDIHVVTDNNNHFCACYMNNGGYQKDDNGSYVNYDALRSCFAKLNTKFKGKRVSMPIIGASYYDGNGDKDLILSMMDEEFTDIRAYVYDYEQKDFKLEIFRKINEVRSQFKEKDITQDEYLDLMRELEWKRTHGIYTPINPKFKYIPLHSTKSRIIRINKNNRLNIK